MSKRAADHEQLQDVYQTAALTCVTRLSPIGRPPSVTNRSDRSRLWPLYRGALRSLRRVETGPPICTEAVSAVRGSVSHHSKHLLLRQQGKLTDGVSVA